MYKITGKCLCGGNVVLVDAKNLKPHQKPIPQCMHCFNKPPKLRYEEIQRSTKKGSSPVVPVIS